MYLTKVLCSLITKILFITHLVNRCNDRLLPLLKQILFIPNIINKFVDVTANCSTPYLIISVGFDQYLVVCVFLVISTSKALDSGTSGSAVWISV